MKLARLLQNSRERRDNGMYAGEAALSMVHVPVCDPTLASFPLDDRDLPYRDCTRVYVEVAGAHGATVPAW
jgi:hypothetical protein